MRRTTIFILTILLFGSYASGQLKPVVSTAKYFDKTQPLRDITPHPPMDKDNSWKDGVIPNETPERVQINDNPLPHGADPVLQDRFGDTGLGEELVNFDAMPNLCSCYPPDTDGDVGPDHYFQMINLHFQIFDKQGNSLYGPAANKTLWDGFIGPWTYTNDGDPIVLYDEEADRWIATQFAVDTPDDTFWELIAVSETGDPLGAWYRYAFQYPVFNDYPKLGVWNDAYYCSFNMFGSYRRVAASAYERDAMLVGDTNARHILFDLPSGSQPWSMLPADFDGPPPPEGTPNYFVYAMDDAFGSGDELSMWAFTVDWDDPGLSTFEEITVLPVEPFDSEICNAYRGRCIHQPQGGNLLESISDRLMFRLQYRNFGDYQVMVTNHTVDASGFGHAGIRWYEMRDNNDGNGWFIYQQGTYAPDEHHRWMGSIAMNGNGDIALGFSVSGIEKYPSIHYTGRSAGSPLGVMTFYEEEIVAGGGIQSGEAARWGDYSMMSVDPADDSTFWYTTEYMKSSGATNWQTRIAAFQLIEDQVPPAPVTDLLAEATTSNAIALIWTATGNDGETGTAFLYDIRYSTDPIDEDNFGQATQAEEAPDPQEAGTPEYFLVTGLDYSTLYYFAMKVRDRQFNFSGLSNSSSATTTGPPLLTVDEDTVYQKIFAGSVGTRPWSLKNLGDGDIYYTIYKDSLSGTEPGGVFNVYDNGSSANAGMAWADGYLYMIDMQGNALVRYDTAAQEIMESMPIHDAPYGIAWDGTMFWIGSEGGIVHAYHLDGIPAGESFPLPFEGFSALAWDGEYFLANFILERDPVIYKLDNSGNVHEHIMADVGRMNIWQSVWVSDHQSGQYWFTNNSGIIAQMKLVDGEAVIVKQFDAPATNSFALTHDHYDLWYGLAGGKIFQVDDGIDEVNWLTVSPETETIAGGEDLNSDLTFSTMRIDTNVLHATVTISSNDLAIPEYRIPVTMKVSTIDIGPDTNFCGHLSLLLDAGEGFAGYLWSDGSTSQALLVDSVSNGLGPTAFWVDVQDIGGTIERDSILVTFDDCTAIYEFDDGTVVSVRPNPTSGIVEVDIEGLTESMTLEVIDLGGRVLYHEEIVPGQQPHRNIRLDLTAEPVGVYVIRMSSQGMSLSQKLLKR